MIPISEDVDLSSITETKVCKQCSQDKPIGAFVSKNKAYICVICDSCRAIQEKRSRGMFISPLLYRTTYRREGQKEPFESKERSTPIIPFSPSSYEYAQREKESRRGKFSCSYPWYYCFKLYFRWLYYPSSEMGSCKYKFELQRVRTCNSSVIFPPPKVRFVSWLRIQVFLSLFGEEFDVNHCLLQRNVCSKQT